MEKIIKEKDGQITEVTINFQADTMTEFKDVIWDLGFSYPNMLVAHASGACGSHTLVLVNPNEE